MRIMLSYLGKQVDARWSVSTSQVKQGCLHVTYPVHAKLVVLQDSVQYKQRVSVDGAQNSKKHMVAAKVVGHRTRTPEKACFVAGSASSSATDIRLLFDETVMDTRLI